MFNSICHKFDRQQGQFRSSWSYLFQSGKKNLWLRSVSSPLINSFILNRIWENKKQIMCLLVMHLFIKTAVLSIARRFTLSEIPRTKKRGFVLTYWNYQQITLSCSIYLLNSVVYKRKNNLFHTYFIEYHRNRL